MKPWREIAIPHRDVLEGTFQQSEFAADITAVRDGRATREYQDAAAFFERTYITEGMRNLLTQVAQRLNGVNGEPVVQLQTAFGGGKTHTLLAVYHLATRSCSLQELSGVPALLDQAGLMDVPRAKVAILDGTAHAPGQPWKHGRHTVRTLWGELAWQLGGAEGLDAVREADQTGTSPGKDSLRALLAWYAPCVVLIDELVAYIRQFTDGAALPGGTYDSNLSFVQALTEAAKGVPNAIVLASLPESEIEAGSSRGVSALRALEKTFGRIQALWKPVGTEEGFEIVRRRLFEPIHDESGRDEACRAFAAAYTAEGARLPSETQEARYLDRLQRAYPIHPEVFDRLYEDWTTLESFQRTRGVLKLMAKAIFKLWKDQNRDGMILPSSLPLYDSGARNELTYYLQPGWDPVIEQDIDGDRSEAAELDMRETRFGAVQAARRVARTLFLGSAPSSMPTRGGNRGIDRGRVLLGCLQPGQSASLYLDALSRLSDRSHYLNTSGDRALDTTRYWFDTRANLRREMEDRKGRFDDKNEVRGRIASVVQKLVAGSELFASTHVFTPHGDIGDDSNLRLVVLSPDLPYSRQDPRVSSDAVLDYVAKNGERPRYKGNRLVFLAADHASLSRLRDSARTALAWGSIVDDIKNRRLVIDRLQEEQAQKEQITADDVLRRAARECYRWVLCPAQQSPQSQEKSVEAHLLNTAGSTLPAEIDRVCKENELVITVWSPMHLRAQLQEVYWKADRPAVRAMAVWEDMQKYLFLARLRDRSVLEQTILKGAYSADFFGTAYGQTGEHYDGFKLGDPAVQVDDTLLLIEPSAALAYKRAQERPPEPELEDTDPRLETGTTGIGTTGTGTTGTGETGKSGTTGAVKSVGNSGQEGKKPAVFFGSVDVNAASAKMKLIDIASEIIAVLASDPRGQVKVTVEIHAEYPQGVQEHVKRAVSENAGHLGFKSKEWE